ncbi:hypothetical protein LWI28_028774 [Acer negundo]|uniref:Uncharacterized protein n=1 Tax=Acer negundo TaxID=4023 RepID=A0AAD5IGW2_ACENE|nr:hypothetical protein LWI28_028774 [Acer negundo]
MGCNGERYNWGFSMEKSQSAYSDTIAALLRSNTTWVKFSSFLGLFLLDMPLPTFSDVKDSMDSFWQNLGSSCEPNENIYNTDWRTHQDSSWSNSENSNDLMSPSWSDQGIESAFEDNFNISNKATTQNYNEASYQSEQEEH